LELIEVADGESKVTASKGGAVEGTREGGKIENFGPTTE